MKPHNQYIEKQLRTLPVEKLWEIIEVLLLLHPDMPDKTVMNYEQVLELCIILKEGDEMFRDLEQIAILKNGIDSLSKHKT